MEETAGAALDDTKLIGLYWFSRNFKNFVLVHKEPRRSGEKYLNWIISSKDHYDYWNEMYAAGKVPGPDYDAYPRGRVSFNLDTNMFTVYHGNWLTPQVKALLLKEFNLTKKETVFESDEHYNLTR
ncbi:MAG: hypothetical protein WCR31_08510 [Treponema sp.]